MSHPIESFLVPSALLRIRQFMSRSGLKVRPWAAPAETLESFLSLLQERRDDADFWQRLSILLSQLVCDLKQRRTHGLTAVRNEILDPERHESLLTELRTILHDHRAETFPGLCRRLSHPALATLSLLAGVALVGCGGETDSHDDFLNDEPKYEIVPLGGSGGASSSQGGTVGAQAGALNTQGGSYGGGITIVIPPGTGGTTTEDPTHCDLTLAEILTDCKVDTAYRDELVACVGALNDSWQSGIRSILSCNTCQEVERQLCLIEETCNDPSLAEAYSFEEFVNHCVVVLYRGVAFE